MATRDRKSKVSAESPTPTANRNIESPSTPKSDGNTEKVRRGGRVKKQLNSTQKDNTNEEENTSEEIILQDKSADAKEDKKIENKKPRARQDDNEDKSSKDSPKRQMGTRSLEALKKTTTMKRRSLPAAITRIGKALARRNSTGRLDLRKIIKAEEKSDKDNDNGSKKNRGRPRKGGAGSELISATVKRKLSEDEKELDSKPEKLLKIDEEKNINVHDSEINKVGPNIDTSAKCSNLIDQNVKDTLVAAEEKLENNNQIQDNIKDELMDDDEIIDDKNNTDDKNITDKSKSSGNINDTKLVRRSNRSTKSVTKERESTPKLKSEIKSEPTTPTKNLNNDQPSNSVEPSTLEEPTLLHIDTSTTVEDKDNTIKAGSPISIVKVGETEKSSSLSPSLESEGISEISVKQFYKEPAFLENNLGIEKDPKLGEIVQEKSIIAVDILTKESIHEISEDTPKETITPESKQVTPPTKSKLAEKKKDIKKRIELNKESEATKTVGRKKNAKTEPKKKENLKATANKKSLQEKKVIQKNKQVPKVSNDKKVKSITSVKKDNDIKNVVIITKKEDEKVADLVKVEPLTKAEFTETETTQASIPETSITNSLINIDDKKIEVIDNECDNVNDSTNKTTVDYIKSDESIKCMEKNDFKIQEIKNLNDNISNVNNDKLERPIESNLVTSKDKAMIEKSANKEESVKMEIEPYNICNITTEINSEKTGKNINKEMTIEAIEVISKDTNNIKEEKCIKSTDVLTLEIVTPMEVVETPKQLISEFNKIGTNCELHIADDKLIDSQVDTTANSKSQLIISNGSITNKTDEIKEKLEIQINNPEEKSSDNKENIVKIEKSKVELQQANSKEIDNRVKEIIIVESPETIKQKESHLKSLGLLTIKAADEAKIEKLRQKELLQSSSSATSTKTSKSQKSNEYTGTLKTVIKLHRPQQPEKQTNQNNDKKKRLPLKMTFQKGRGKNISDKDSTTVPGNTEETYYTIQNDSDNTDSHGGQNRKTHYRSYTDGNIVSEPVKIKDPDNEATKILVIPEKASSFSIHPGRICMDQCFYCGGKFGLFDTPCHVAQLKSVERQKKILDNEEKLTVDSCLCDACYRHVDRRANCPSYKKRLSAPTPSSTVTSNNTPELIQNNNQEELTHKVNHLCHATNCNQIASHSLRKKWFIKMKKSINKLIDINFETTNIIQGMIPICDQHYDVISHLMTCTLCKRKLPRNHIYYITQEISTLEEHFKTQGIPVLLGSTPVVCKICRYFANLLLKPPEPKTQKAQFMKNYRRRLLQFHNVVDAEEESENDDIVQNPKVVIPTAAAVQVSSQIVHSKKSTEINRKLDELRENSNTLLKQQKKSPETIRKLDESVEGGHILLDNDVMVDYDVPMLEKTVVLSTSKSSRLSQNHTLATKQIANKKPASENIDINSDMARVLRANPSISMRELFPGEEEMGLYANLPLNNGKKTPEGWSKVTTTLQYDDVTKQMWEELQKPYGNQSSFLRHLVLLEKYFRNGDLMLSQNASYNAVSYSESVQNRLRSYDNIPTGGLSIMQQLSNAPISITPSVTIKPKPKISPDISTPISSSVSTAPAVTLVKSNPTASSQSNNKSNRQITVTNDSKQKEILAAASKLIKSDETSITPAIKKNNASLPPELISIAKSNQSAIAITPISNQKSPASTVVTSVTLQLNTSNTYTPAIQITSTATPPATVTTVVSSPALQSPTSNHPIPSTSKSIPSNVIKLPDTLSPSERKQTNGKPWRPTLIPITPGSNNNYQGPLFQTADGRRLPSLVQVMSGGKPYHISIHDYNRMCILRREKLIQLQQLQQSQKNQGNQPGSVGLHHPLQIPAYNQKKASSTEDANTSKSTPVNINKKERFQIPNKILEQNSLIPVNPNKNSSSAEKNKKNLSSSLLKNHVTPIMPKPPQLPNSTNVLSVTSTLPSSISATVVSTMSSAASSISTSFANQNIISPHSFHHPSSIEITKSSPSYTPQSTYSWNSNENFNGSCSVIGTGSGGSLLLDNAAVSVLSKIPKSLTVIPQQKDRSRMSSSSEDQNSA